MLVEDMIFWHPSQYGYIQNINHLVQRRGILDTPLDLLHSSVWKARLKWCVAMMQALICCLNPKSIGGFCCLKNEKIKTRLSYKTAQIVNICSYEDVWKTTSKQKLSLIYIFFKSSLSALAVCRTWCPLLIVYHRGVLAMCHLVWLRGGALNL